MRTPSDRTKFMDELKANLEDVIFEGTFARARLAKRDISKEMGREYYINYTEENAPQIIIYDHINYTFDGDGHMNATKTNVRIEFVDNGEDLAFYRNNKYINSIHFSDYRNKTTYTAAVAFMVGKLGN